MKNFMPASILVTFMVAATANAVTVNNLNTYLASDDRCLDAMLDRYLWVRGKDAQWVNKSTHEKYENALTLYQQQSTQDGKGFNTIFNGPWDRALVPVFDAQRDTIFDSLLTVDTTGGLMQGVTLDESGDILTLDAVEKYLKAGKPTVLQNMVQTVAKAFGAKQKPLSELTSPTEKEEAYSSWAKNTAAIAAACTQMSALQSLSCTKATSDLLADASFNANMILPKIWNEFITSQKLREGVRQGALIIIGRIKSKKPGHLFDDLRLGFKRAGFSDSESNEATWKLLAIYGNGGPNAGYRLFAFDLPPETSLFSVGLSVISASISYLDFYQMITCKTHYALPPEVSGCLTPKPYHFWLNAYFARSLVKSGYSAEVAQMATFILAKGYQVNRDLNNAGGGLEKILSKPSNHPTNEVVRIDLVLAAAGVVYGSHIEGIPLKPFSLSGGLTDLIAHRGNVEGVSKDLIQSLMASDRLKLLRAWDQLFQPNESLAFFRKQQE